MVGVGSGHLAVGLFLNLASQIIQLLLKQFDLAIGFVRRQETSVAVEPLELRSGSRVDSHANEERK
jgi:hypothetical protein